MFKWDLTWGHVKVFWSRECSRDCTRDKASLQRDSKTWWKRTTKGRDWVFYLGVTKDVIGTYYWDVVDTYHWDVSLTYHWDVIGCFIWELFEVLWRRIDETSSLRPHKTSAQHTNKTLWRRTTKTWLGVSFEKYLRRHWNVQRDVVTTSSRRLVAGWVATFPQMALLGPLGNLLYLCHM